MKCFVFDPTFDRTKVLSAVISLFCKNVATWKAYMKYCKT